MTGEGKAVDALSETLVAVIRTERERHENLGPQMMVFNVRCKCGHIGVEVSQAGEFEAHVDESVAAVLAARAGAVDPLRQAFEALDEVERRIIHAIETLDPNGSLFHVRAVRDDLRRILAARAGAVDTLRQAVEATLKEADRRIQQTPAEEWGFPLAVGATEAEQRGYFMGANQAIDFAASVLADLRRVLDGNGDEGES